MHDYWIAVIQGIVEGLTEFLPVSSTGHLILTGDLLHFEGPKAATFEIVIQLGAILAVAVLYWRRILQLLGLRRDRSRFRSQLNLLHVLLAILPAMILGLLFHKAIKTYLFSPKTVLIGLVAGGIFMIAAEKWQRRVRAREIDDLSYGQAFSIGLAQCLALWPGFSRSGATIAGGLLTGASHKAAADFSFLIAIPMMVAASGYDLLKSYKDLSIADLDFFAIGFAVSFLVALLAVVSFLKLLERVKLTPFAYYRFLAAALFWIFVLR
ncbi:undecaprenyl-diphosphate phosphatase [Effusibacillus pohliae]|uniref:undecaprenyl-diphosphate phosphatase n=1 Tax=Effusibacillus pohliae TaxID=232270 RepID=UPI00036CA660|nr:undecaprenyl-diphosphate phosphatase [Effusibacillus pohliae]